MKKRILSLLVALCLIVGMLPLTVLASTGSVKFIFQKAGEYTGWVSLSDAANYPDWLETLTLAPGQVAFYTTEKGVDGVRPNNYYLKSGANEETYNVKFDYTGDAVVVYLRNATISNTVGLFYGDSGNFNAAPLNIVVEKGTSTITTTGGYSSLALFSDGDATITGPGKLNVNCNGITPTWGAIYAGNDIKLEEADVAVHLLAGGSGAVTATTTSGIASRKGGDIIIDASKLSITSPAAATNAISSAFYGTINGAEKSNLIIRNGSNVKVAANAAYENWTTDANGNAHTGLIFIPGTVSVSYSDLEVAGLGSSQYRRAFRNINTSLSFEGCTVQRGSTYSAYPSYDEATGVITAPGSLTTGVPDAATLNNMSYLKVTHEHVKNDEPTYEELPPCAENGVAIYACQYCGMEMREPGVAVNPTEDHTPSDTPTYEMINRADSITELGSYKTQTKCSACGKVLEESDPISFGAAPFFYYGSEMGTTGSDWLSGSPKHLLNPGDPAVYLVTTASNNPAYYYLATGAEGYWNVKLEYPWGGTPTMTLKGATIKNGCGIFYGFFGAANETTAPLNIVVEEASTIEVYQTGNNNNCALSLNTTGGVTISGSGLLTLKGNGLRGPLSVRGNLTLDNANIHIEVPNYYPQGPVIQVYNGDLTIKGGTLYGNGYGERADGGFVSCLVEANNMTIQDGANVTLFGAAVAAYNDAFAAFKVSGDITINESNVEFACLGLAFEHLFNKAPIVSAGSTIIAGQTSNEDGEEVEGEGLKHVATYVDGVLVAPEITGEFDPTNLSGCYYYKVTKATKVPELLSSTTVGSSLTFTMSVPVADINATNLTATITRNGKTTPATVSKKDIYGVSFYVVEYAGIAAKEMGDEFTLALFDADGNPVIEPLTDSILAYAIRGLESTDPKATNELKTLLIDMLIYGAYAQKTLIEGGVADADLVTYGLDDYIAQYASKNVDFIDEPAAAAKVTGNDVAAYRGSSLVLESNISMVVGVYNYKLDEGETYAKVSFTSHDGTKYTDVPVEIDKGRSSESLTMFSWDKLAAADTDSEVTFTVYNNGEELFTVTDTIAKYCARANANGLEIAEYLLKYSVSAYAYLPHNDNAQ